MRHSLPALLALTVAVAACAKNTDLSPVGTDAQTVTVVTGGGSQTLRIRQDDATNTQVVDSPLETVWKVLPAVYDSLGVAISRVDPASRTIGADNVKMRRSLKGVPLSRYFDCGQTQIGANADDYEVTITLLTRVRAATPASTRVEITTIATARPVARRQNPLNCTTLGTLDAKLLATLKTQAAGGR